MTTKSGGDGDEDERRWKEKLFEERKEARKRRYYALPLNPPKNFVPEHRPSPGEQGFLVPDLRSKVFEL
ncbi:hypothetical protein DMENIID0001_158610 [Sergentomyia squamirostris]